MALRDIVNVFISFGKAGVKQAGFGIPLVLSASGNFTGIAYVSDPSELGSLDLNDTPEGNAISQMFAQEPSPAKVAIGKLTFKPTLRVKIGIKSGAVANAKTYSFSVKDSQTHWQGVISFTADASATNDEIITGLMAAVTAAAASIPSITGSVSGATGSTVLELAGSASGKFFTVFNLDSDVFTFENITSDVAGGGFAAQLAAFKLLDSGWYAVACCYQSKTVIDAISSWVEQNDRLYVAQTTDSAVVDPNVTSDIASTCLGANRKRTAIIFHPVMDDFADFAWLGKCLPFTPGEETWKFKTLANVTAGGYNSTQENALSQKRCNYYIEIAGISMTTEGVVSQFNGYIDLTRGQDWLQARIAESVFALLASSPKVAYTESGIAMIEGAIRAVLQDGVTNGLLAADPAPVVIMPKISAISSQDKTDRKLRNAKFSATLAGAIHSVDVNGLLEF